MPARPGIHTVFPKEGPALKPIVNPEVKRVDSESGSLRPVVSRTGLRHGVGLKSGSVLSFFGLGSKAGHFKEQTRSVARDEGRVKEFLTATSGGGREALRVRK